MGQHGRLRDTWPLHRRQVAQLLLAFVVMTGGFVLLGWWLTNPMRNSGLVRTDDDVAVWLERHRTPTWNTLSWWGSMLAETIPKIVVTAIVLFVFLRVWKRWLEPVLVAVALILEASVFLATTLIDGRPRREVEHVDGSPIGSSFPSGHAAAAVVYGAIAIVVFWHTRKVWARALAVVVCAVVPLVVGLSRMYRGMHHLTDTIAGALLGVVALGVTYAVVTGSPERRDATLRWQRPARGRPVVATVLGDDGAAGDDRRGPRR
jgi:undecaprenyl-diphosphatase